LIEEKPRGGDGRGDALGGFTDGGIGEADGDDFRFFRSSGVDLDFDLEGVDAFESGGEEAGDHSGCDYSPRRHGGHGDFLYREDVMGAKGGGLSQSRRGAKFFRFLEKECVAWIF